MFAIGVVAWIHFIAAGILTVMALNGSIVLISPAIAALIAGFLFLAIEKALNLLTEIRDRLPQPTVAGPGAEQVAAPTEARPVRTLAEVEADLERLQAKRSA